MIWLVVTTLATVSSTVEVSSSTRWVARGPGRHTSRISRVLSLYSRDQKVRSGGVGSLGGVKVARGWGAGNVRVRGGVPGGDVVEWTGTWLRLVPSYTWLRASFLVLSRYCWGGSCRSRAATSRCSSGRGGPRSCSNLRSLIKRRLAVTMGRIIYLKLDNFKISYCIKKARN